jgi:hypothetical protein
MLHHQPFGLIENVAVLFCILSKKNSLRQKTNVEDKHNLTPHLSNYAKNSTRRVFSHIHQAQNTPLSIKQIKRRFA